MNLMETLTRLQAIVTDSHVVYTSGRHDSAYVNKDVVYLYTVVTEEICGAIASLFKGVPIDTVIGPTVGGVILAQGVAHRLTKRRRRTIYAAYAEKEGTNKFVIKRGYDRMVEGHTVLVVEDVINTGGSVKNVIDAVRHNGGKVIGVGALCNQGGLTAHRLGVPRLEALLSVALEAWDAAACPLCQTGVPINTTVGKGREFLATQSVRV